MAFKPVLVDHLKDFKVKIFFHPEIPVIISTALYSCSTIEEVRLIWVKILKEGYKVSTLKIVSDVAAEVGVVLTVPVKSNLVSKMLGKI